MRQAKQVKPRRETPMLHPRHKENRNDSAGFFSPSETALCSTPSSKQLAAETSSRGNSLVERVNLAGHSP